MASPQIENGHINIANTIIDKFCSYRLSGQEWQVLWVVIRKTWGWLENPKSKSGLKKKMDKIALSQFAELTGIDRRKCHALLTKLVNKKLLVKTVTQKGDKTTIRYGFQKDFDMWEVSPKKVTVTQLGDRVSPKKASKLSPKKAHTKEKKETIQKITPINFEEYVAANANPNVEKSFSTELCKFVGDFIDYVIKEKGNKAPKKTKRLINTSLDTVDKLIRIDGFTLEYIRAVARWAVVDKFYSTSFFSLASLRNKSKTNDVSKFINMASRYDKEVGTVKNGPPPTIEEICKSYGL